MERYPKLYNDFTLRLPKPILIALLFCCKFVSAQDSSRLDKAISFPDRVYSLLDKKASSIEQRLDKQTEKYLCKIQKQENKLRRKLYRKDSVLAKQLFDGVNEKYNQLKWGKNGAECPDYVYSAHLDSISGAVRFLQTQNSGEDVQLQETLDRYKELQAKLNASERVRRYLILRRELLKNQLQQLGMIKQLKKIRENVFYYQEQIQTYRQMLEDPNKVEKQLMSLVTKIPEFKEFFSKNSMIASLFGVSRINNPTSAVSYSGLQTRAGFSQLLANRFGPNANVAQQVQQNLQAGQNQLSALKSRIGNYSSGSFGNSSGDIEVPKHYNSQKTKSFFQRVEYGGNVQSQKGRYHFPVTSDIALSIGYKINDKSTIGLEGAYKLGWGSSWNNIRISHQGVAFRSFLDWKIKGSLYVSGGYEQNYMSIINTIDQLKNHSAWQTSGVAGVCKKYALNKKMKGEVKLLWDFLSYSQVPKGQPILFRIGYLIK